MSPAEKAKELYTAFDEATPPIYDYDNVRPVVIKGYVKILCKEIEESGACEYEHTANFWHSVKEEITKL